MIWIPSYLLSSSRRKMANTFQAQLWHGKDELFETFFDRNSSGEVHDNCTTVIIPQCSEREVLVINEFGHPVCNCNKEKDFFRNPFEDTNVLEECILWQGDNSGLRSDFTAIISTTCKPGYTHRFSTCNRVITPFEKSHKWNKSNKMLFSHLSFAFLKILHELFDKIHLLHQLRWFLRI